MPFFIALAIALVLTWAARHIGFATGMVDRPTAILPPSGGHEALKIHARPIPVLGGMAVMTGVLATLLVADGQVGFLVAAGVALATLVGLVDDVRPLSASSRMLALTAAGGLLVAGGVRVVPLGWFRAAAVVVLVLLLTNAVNLIDGQDGLAGGLGAFAGLGLAAISLAGGGDSSVALALAGALVGFLVWNAPPARVFLGNSGAYGLGALLAVLAARTSTAHGWRGLLAAGLCLGVFAFELALTVLRRLSSGHGLAVGDRRHSYDLLARAVGSRRRSTLVFWCLGGAAAAAALLLDEVPLAIGVWLFVAAAAAGALVGSRFWRQAAAEIAMEAGAKAAGEAAAGAARQP